jgi:hypothetical protein
MLLKTIIGMSSEAGGSGGITTTPHNLTSNDSDPRYIVSQSSTLDIREAWMAMDGKIDPEGETESHTNQGYNEWWQITFNEGAVKMKSFTFTNRGGGFGYLSNPYYLQGSNDESEWIDVLQFDLGETGGESFSFDVDCEEKYPYWRILSPGYTYLIIGEIEFTYESNSGGGFSGGNIIEADENCYVIEVQIDDTSSPISISDEGGNYGLPPIIDWGDGTLIENDWNSLFEHYYNETGTYKIIWRNGYSEAMNSFYIGSTNRITNVPQLSYNRNDWGSLFAGCNFGDDVTVNFGNPPENLTTASNMFYNTSCNTIRIICGSNVLSDFSVFFTYSTIQYFYASDKLFGIKNDLYVNLNSAFRDCYNLVGFYTENGVNGGYLHYNGNFNYMFQNCYNLYLGDGDWNNMHWMWNWTADTNSRFGATRSVRQMFYQCYNLQGTVEPTAFWNHSEVNQIYTDYEMCFTQTNIGNINDAKSNDWA